MIIQTKELEDRQINEVIALAQQCRDIDKNEIPIYKHILLKKRAYPSTLLYYEDTKLIAFLSAFFFYPNCCEVSLMVNPNKRNQGISYKLLRYIYPLFKEHAINHLLFSVSSDFLQEFLLHNSFKYTRSEYDMVRNSSEKININNQDINFRESNKDDFLFILNLDKLCFGNENNINLNRIDTFLKDKDNKILLLDFKDKSIGKLHIHINNDYARLTDIAILPEMQNKGYGSLLIGCAVNYILARNIKKFYWK